MVRVLVGTGATYTMLPRRLLAELGVRPKRKQFFRLANGHKVERDLAVVWARYGDRAFPTQVIVGERGDASLMGVMTLEELGLQVDPRTQRLRQVKVQLLVSAMAA